MNKDIKIVCPYCGQEYLPAEIFIPKAFFGVPESIKRDCQGKISDFEGTPMDLREEYKCDCCDKKFYIDAQVKFSTSKVEEKYDFDKEYSTSLKIKKYSLIEDK